MSNYILLSLCILFLIKTSLTLIKAEVLAFQARHFSFLTIPCVPGKKASKRIEGEKKKVRQRETGSSYIQIKPVLAVVFLRSPVLTGHHTILQSCHHMWDIWLQGENDQDERITYSTSTNLVNHSCSLPESQPAAVTCHILDLRYVQCNIYQWSFQIFH